MNLRQIEVFRAVMHTGSTVDAARLLHVSQPGISRMIRHLELRLEVSLFERTKGRLAATPEARALYESIERVYRGVHQVQQVASHLRFGGHSTLRVLASANVGLQLVPRAIARLNEQFAQSTVEFESVPLREIVRLLVAEEADLAITSAPLEHPALDVREIGRWTLTCAVPAGHRLATARPLRIKEALAERLVTYSPEAPQTRVIDQWLELHGIARNVAVEVRSGYSACAMVAAGIGIAFVDDLSARAHRTEGIVYLPVPKAPRFPLFSVVNVHRPLSRMGKALLSLAASELKELQRGGLAATKIAAGDH